MMKMYLVLVVAMLACVWGCGKEGGEPQTSTIDDRTRTILQADKVQTSHEVKDKLEAIDAQRKKDIEDAGL